MYNVNTTLSQNSSPDSLNSILAVACVTLGKFTKICKTKSSNIYLVQWQDMIGPAGRLNAEVVVETMTEDDQIKAGKVADPVIFLAQYVNFAHVFNKSRADMLPEYTQHNLVIKTENNKIPLFSFMYDHSRLELEFLCDYIDDMLAKKFIRLFKSPLGAAVFFTKKIDGGSRLYIDF